RDALIAAALVACGTKHRVRDDAAAKRIDARIADMASDAAPPVRPEHAAFALVANRHAAHRALDGELVVDAGDIGLARYMRFGVPAPRWHLGQDVDGERAAIADKLASLEIPLTAEQAKATQITMRVHGDSAQAI